MERRMFAGRIMTTDITRLTPESALIDALKGLAVFAGQLPIVHDDGTIAGVITAERLLRRIMPIDGVLPEFIRSVRGLEGQTVGQFMESEYLSVTPEAGALELGRIFSASGIHSTILVVDNAGILLGVITAREFFKRLLEYSA
jgi:CBS-domain-containing membrane protein